jgi:hypothetical protein
VPTTKHMTDAVNVIALGTLKRTVRSPLASGGTVRNMATASSAATPRNAQNTARQLVTLVTTPPTTRPVAPAAAPPALHNATARSRIPPRSANVVKSRSAEGTDAAAAAP